MENTTIQNTTETSAPASAALDHIDIEAYTRLALVTDMPSAAADPSAPSYDNVLRRFADNNGEFGTPDYLQVLVDALREQVDAGNNSDTAKRAFFYGSALKINRQLLPAKYAIKDQEAIVQSRLREPHVIRLIHFILGISSEAAEIAEGLLNYLVMGDEIDWVNLVKEEPGDLCWYTLGLAFDIFAQKFNRNPIEILAHNIDKLEKRYGRKFSEYLANNRNLKVERSVLETAGLGAELLGDHSEKAKMQLAQVRAINDGVMGMQTRIRELEEENSRLRALDQASRTV